jgi:hypothetical protein
LCLGAGVLRICCVPGAEHKNESGPSEAGPYEAALAAGAECLLELELIQGKTRGDAVLQQHLKQVTGSLRFALAQMRLARERDRRGLGYGFVIGDSVEPEP